MAGCTKCGGELDLNPEQHEDLGIIGIFCKPCVSELAAEGRELVAQHRREHGDFTVNERLRLVRQVLEQPVVRH